MTKQSTLELLVASTHFWIESKQSKSLKKEFEELIGVLKSHIRLYRNKRVDNTIEVLTNVYNKLNRVTDDKDVEANAFILSIGCIDLLRESNYFKGSDKLKTDRLTKSIYDKVEKSEQLANEFRNANEIISKLQKEMKWLNLDMYIAIQKK